MPGPYRDAAIFFARSTKKFQRVEKGVLPPWPPLRGGSARRRWGRELYDYPKYFGLWQGSLPPPLRGTSLAEGGLLTHWGEHCPPLQSSWSVEGGTGLDQNVRLDAQAGFAALLGFDEEKPGRGVGAVLDKSQTLRLKARGA